MLAANPVEKQAFDLLAEQQTTAGGRSAAVDATQTQTLAQVDFEKMQPPPEAQPNLQTTSPLGFDQHHLPSDSRGTWIEGTKGNGVFEFNDSPFNREKGLVGTKIRFENGYIAKGGFPPEWYYKGNAEFASVDIPVVVNGRTADFKAADTKMRMQHPGYTWNHAGPPGSTTMELILTKEHGSIAHEGNASLVRKAARTTATGVTARALGIITIYTSLRDALQASGDLQPSFKSINGLYHFGEEDGSVFSSSSRSGTNSECLPARNMSLAPKQDSLNRLPPKKWMSTGSKQNRCTENTSQERFSGRPDLFQARNGLNSSST